MTEGSDVFGFEVHRYMIKSITAINQGLERIANSLDETPREFYNVNELEIILKTIDRVEESVNILLKCTEKLEQIYKEIANGRGIWGTDS